MRYPMWRRNTDGTEVVVRNQAEAYSSPETIAAFLPNKPIPESVEDPAPEQEAEPVEAPEAEVKRGPGRPKKANS